MEFAESALGLLAKLNEAGYAAYLVGGCVRDAFMGREPGDYDVATSAPPQAVKRLFPKTADTGLAHGTVTVLLDRPFEVTTFRTDGGYDDCRHPNQVCFVGDLETDLARRDFTVNAMAWHPAEGVTDPFGGRDDIKNKTIRAVGEASIRFQEDALRILRGVRFSAQLGFCLAEKTKSAMAACAPLVERLSAERVREELYKILLSPRPDAVKTLEELGVLALILPEVSRLFKTGQNTPYHAYDVGRHTMLALMHTPPRLTVRLGALLHDVGKPDAKTTDSAGVDHFHGHGPKSVLLADEILKKLRATNKTRREVLALIKWHDFKFSPDSPASMRRAVSKIGPRRMEDLLALQTGDAYGKNPKMLEQNLAKIRLTSKAVSEVMRQNCPLSIKDLAVDGNDLLSLGIAPKEIGGHLSWLLDAVLEDPLKNKKNILLECVKNKTRDEKTGRR